MIQALLAMAIAINPAAAAGSFAPDRRGDRPRPIAVGAAVAVAVYVALAVASEAVRDLLDVNLGTYRLGAGAVVVVTGLRWLVAGPARPIEEPESDRGLAAVVAFPVLFTPAAAAMAVSVGADGAVAAVIGVLVAVGVAALALYRRRSVPPALLAGAVRLLGAGAVVVGVAECIDGIRTL